MSLTCGSVRFLGRWRRVRHHVWVVDVLGCASRAWANEVVMTTRFHWTKKLSCKKSLLDYPMVLLLGF